MIFFIKYLIEKLSRLLNSKYKGAYYSFIILNILRMNYLFILNIKFMIKKFFIYKSFKLL